MDALVARRLEVVMRESQADVAPVGPGALLSTAHSAMRRGASASQRVINHNCFNSINDVFRPCLSVRWNPVVKRMNLLGYFYRDVGSSKGPPQARNRLTRGFAMPCADRDRTERR
jgi:hypothetical protein